MGGAEVMEIKTPETMSKIEYIDNYMDQPIDKKTEKAVKALEGIQKQSESSLSELKNAEDNNTSDRPVLDAWNKAKKEAFGIEKLIMNDPILRGNEELKYAFVPEGNERLKKLNRNPESAKQIQFETGENTYA